MYGVEVLMKLLDTSVIILFADFIFQWECIDHLHNIKENLRTTTEVHGEYYSNSEAWMIEDILKDLINENKLKIIVCDLNDSKREIKHRFPNLHDGELSILSLGKFLKSEDINYYCVLDEKHARKAARNMDLKFTGSIGLLKKIKDSDIWDNSELKDLVEAISGSPFWVSEKVLMELYDE